jgi:hypothetical protein
MALVVTAIAVIAAAAPHAFFAPPLQLHMEGQMQAWLGIAVWAPAILSGVAFFFGVGFGRRNDALDDQLTPETRTVLLVALILAFVVATAGMYELLWVEMEAMRPWAELKTVLPLFAALGLMRGVFWQGFAQDRVMSKMPAARRVLALVVLEVAVVLPFVVQGKTDSVLFNMVPIVALEALVAAVAYEAGFRVRSVMALRAVCGLALVWFQQAMLL